MGARDQVHDGSAAPDAVGGVLADQEGSSNVGARQPVELVEPDVEQVRAEMHPCGVDHDVDGAVALLGGVEHAADLGRSRDVGLIAGRDAAGGDDGVDHRVGCVAVAAVRHQDGGGVDGQPACDRAAEAPGGAGDDGHAGDIHHANRTLHPKRRSGEAPTTMTLPDDGIGSICRMTYIADRAARRLHPRAGPTDSHCAAPHA
ncbi:Uncharacterised protein [Mycobacteroides abscessus subsp. abscessus]|nr:Uncharacterised protein [Mycobacteroides abscessus subsp. abscessus]